jgi:hypothetical protein
MFFFCWPVLRTARLCIIFPHFIYSYIRQYSGLPYSSQGREVAHLVEALRYKLEGRGFNSRWCHLKFLLTHPSGCTMALRSTQPLTEMNTRNISWGVKAAGA